MEVTSESVGYLLGPFSLLIRLLAEKLNASKLFIIIYYLEFYEMKDVNFAPVGFHIVTPAERKQCIRKLAHKARKALFSLNEHHDSESESNKE